MKTTIITLFATLVLYAGQAAAFWAGPGLYIHNGTGVVSLKVLPFHGNAWMPYNGQPLVINVPGETVVIDNSTHTVETKEVQQGRRSTGTGLGKAMMALVAAHHFAVMCQANDELVELDGYVEELIARNQITREVANKALTIMIDEELGGGQFIATSNAVLTFVCKKGELPDPFESFVQ